MNINGEVVWLHFSFDLFLQLHMMLFIYSIIKNLNTNTMKDTPMLLEMLVALTNKNELIDEAIESLQELKNNSNDEMLNKMTALKCLKIFLKVQQDEKSIQEVMKTAVEFNEMTKDLNSD
jgi:hypothetical protein